MCERLYFFQVALRWTVDNAEQFGGNRSSIVILGHGSGAVSLGLHLLSPIGEQDLRPVNRLAFMSGSPLQPLAPNSEVAVVAASFGCNRSRLEGDAEWQWACLLKQPASEFVRARVYASLATGPSFDSDYLPQRWPQISERVLRKQVLMGNTVSEGTIELALKMQLLSNDERNLTALIMDEMESVGLSSAFDISGRVYTNGTSCTDLRCTVDFKEMYGDVMTKCPVLYFSEYLSSLGHSVYSYLLNYKSIPLPVEEAGHAVIFKDDLALLFGEPLLDISSTPFYEQDISRKLIHIFSGFAKTGNLPHASSAEWPRFSRSHNYHVWIDHKGAELISDTRKLVCERLRSAILPPGFPNLPDRVRPVKIDRYF
ncbi:acetylcholinesterase-like [Amblyomma americanum]